MAINERIKTEFFDENCQYLLEMQEGIEALIRYGSQVCGVPTVDSEHDIIVIADTRKLHESNKEHYSKGYGAFRAYMKIPLVHYLLNIGSPSYYQIHEGDIKIKQGVISLNSFKRACDRPIGYVAGRMHKPVQFAYFKNSQVKDCVETAVGNARRKGMEMAVTLCPQEFDHDIFFRKLISLSYLADFRPGFEDPTKQQTILDDSTGELKTIYDPFLGRSLNLSRTEQGFRRKQKGGTLLTRVRLLFKKFNFTAINIKNGVTYTAGASYMARKRKKYLSGQAKVS